MFPEAANFSLIIHAALGRLLSAELWAEPILVLANTTTWLSCSIFKFHPQRRLVPKGILFLIHPILRLVL
jgi:hypothetical protein